MAAIRFEQSRADSCIFRKVISVEVEMMVVGHVRDILAHVKDHTTMEWFVTQLGGRFKLKNLGDCDTAYLARCRERNSPTGSPLETPNPGCKVET